VRAVPCHPEHPTPDVTETAFHLHAGHGRGPLGVLRAWSMKNCGVTVSDSENNPSHNTIRV
jgi:hypothetical protein